MLSNLLSCLVDGVFSKNYYYYLRCLTKLLCFFDSCCYTSLISTSNLFLHVIVVSSDSLKTDVVFEKVFYGHCFSDLLYLFFFTAILLIMVIVVYRLRFLLASCRLIGTFNCFLFHVVSSRYYRFQRLSICNLCRLIVVFQTSLFT